MSRKTCGNCCHFDAVHQLCPLFTLEESMGSYYLKRLSDSPACQSEYLAKPEILVSLNAVEQDIIAQSLQHSLKKPNH